MKIFIQREGGQLPNYRPQGTVDTDDLSPEEASAITGALQPENLVSRGVRAAGNNIAIPDGYTYHVQFEQNGATQSFDVKETSVPPQVQEALDLLVKKVSQSK
ncbi:MAG: protealysin inhibitor emfourin [Phormidesmis sp.]